MHLGIIPDGSRRWARSNGVDLEAAYLMAMEKLGEFSRLALDAGAKSVSIYLLSVDNLSRIEEEVAAAARAEAWFCREILAPLAKDFSLRFHPVGDLTLVPQPLRSALSSLAAEPSRDVAIAAEFFLCAGYDPEHELRAALSAGPGLAPKSEAAGIVGSLLVPYPLDLVIRTGGRSRLSNFLPLQSGYAELAFLECMFNDMTTADFGDCLARLRAAERTRGK